MHQPNARLHDWADLRNYYGIREIDPLREWVPVKLCVTGSRSWTDDVTLRAALEQWLVWSIKGNIIKKVNDGREPLWMLAHGGATQGADYMAARFGLTLNYTVIAYPVQNWKHKGAGLERNQRMLELFEPDEVFAFVNLCEAPKCLLKSKGPHPSHGTRHCIYEAVSRNIPVTIWYAAPHVKDILHQEFDDLLAIQNPPTPNIPLF